MCQEEYILKKREGISLDAWLSEEKNFGLPSENITPGEIDYYSPVEESIAAFTVSTYGICLSCNKHPTAPNPAVGVRHARLKL